jgi:DNA-binding response OmpR family regulator
VISPGGVRAAGGARTAPVILVVEPDRPLRSVVAFLLRHDGLDVLEAADAGSGLRLWWRWEPNLVIVGEGLPALSRWEVCEQIRSADATPVMLLTAAGLTDQQRQALGVTDVVPLPFSTAELLGSVRAALGVQASSTTGRSASR